MFGPQGHSISPDSAAEVDCLPMLRQTPRLVACQDFVVRLFQSLACKEQAIRQREFGSAAPPKIELVKQERGPFAANFASECANRTRREISLGPIFSQRG